MATMIAVVLTDADLSPTELDTSFRAAVDTTFNCVSVDTDTSTSDTAVILASGECGPVDAAEFAAALHAVCLELTKMIAADYPFLDLLWTMIIFFLWVIWFWLLFTVFADIFRRHDISGVKKTVWIIFTILVPFLGVFVYLITQNVGMTERQLARTRAQRDQFDAYVRETAGGSGAAAEIDKAKQLLDSGAITQAEFDTIKQKALG